MEQINYETTGIGCTERQLYSSIPKFIDMTAGIPGCTDSRKYSGFLKDTVPFVAAGIPCTIINSSNNVISHPSLMNNDLDPIPGENQYSIIINDQNQYSTIINGQLNNQYSTIFNGLNNDGTFHYSDGTYNNLQSTFR